MSNSAAALAIAALGLAACDSIGGSALLGMGLGAASGGGGYEYHLKRQKSRIEEDREAGRVDQREYEIRMDQVRRDSLAR